MPISIFGSYFTLLYSNTSTFCAKAVGSLQNPVETLFSLCLSHPLHQHKGGKYVLLTHPSHNEISMTFRCLFIKKVYLRMA